MEKPDRLDRWIPRAMVLAVLAVAVFAFVQSYTHMYLLAQAHHNSGASLRMMPLSVDWVMFAAGLVMLHLGRKGIRHPLPRAALILGATVTLTANIASGIAWGWESATIAAWAPVALFVVVELGMLLVRTAKAKSAQPEIIPWTGPVPPGMVEKIEQQLTQLRTPQPAPEPGPETVTMPAVPEAVTGSPGDTLQGWGQLGRQEPAKPGLNGIGLRNGGQ